MSVKVEAVFESDEQLQGFMALGIGLPKMRIWCVVPSEIWDAKCDSELGDGRYKMSSQYYGTEVNGEIYAVVGRTEVVDGTPTGNYTGPLSLEEQNAWVAKFGSPSFVLEPPEVEEVV